MKIRIFILMAMVSAFTPVVFAQQENNQILPIQTIPDTMPTSYDPWQISLQGGGLWSQKDDSRLRDGAEIVGRFTYDVTPNVALGVESGGLHFKDDINGTRYGYLDGIPGLVDLVFKMPIAATDNRLVPYIYGAAGVIYWSYDKSGYSDNSGVDARSRTHFAAKPGGGLEYYLTPHIALFVEGAYLYAERFNLKNAVSTPPDGKLNVDSIYGGAGLKIAF